MRCHRAKSCHSRSASPLLSFSGRLSQNCYVTGFGYGYNFRRTTRPEFISVCLCGRRSSRGGRKWKIEMKKEEKTVYTYLHKKNHFLTFRLVEDEKIFFKYINYVHNGVGELSSVHLRMKTIGTCTCTEEFIRIVFGCEHFFMNASTDMGVWMSAPWMNVFILGYPHLSASAFLWSRLKKFIVLINIHVDVRLFSGSTLLQEKWKRQRNEVFLYQNQDLPL